MLTDAEYLDRGAEFYRLAQHTSEPTLKKRYADLAASYQIMAEERSRMIASRDEPGNAPQSG